MKNIILLDECIRVKEVIYTIIHRLDKLRQNKASPSFLFSQSYQNNIKETS